MGRELLLGVGVFEVSRRPVAQGEAAAVPARNMDRVEFKPFGGVEGEQADRIDLVDVGGQGPRVAVFAEQRKKSDPPQQTRAGPTGTDGGGPADQLEDPVELRAPESIPCSYPSSDPGRAVEVNGRDLVPRTLLRTEAVK